MTDCVMHPLGEFVLGEVRLSAQVVDQLAETGTPSDPAKHRRYGAQSASDHRNVSGDSTKLVLDRGRRAGEIRSSVGSSVTEVASGSTVEVLQYFHAKLHAHFAALAEVRAALDPVSPVFALEHGLDEELELLKAAVRQAVAAGLPRPHRESWLAFIVYTTESAYAYVGTEYWHSFEAQTPGWNNRNNDWIRSRFRLFADSYGGAVPKGAFAGHFPIIAWPITHAVLPLYLQRFLAKLLFEFSRRGGGLTTDLLHDPPKLGITLAKRTYDYTERFRVFCTNTQLLGQVAAALLSGDDETTPYLVDSTLQRLVEGLSRTQQSRLWLTSARQAASRVRSSGFRGTGGGRNGTGSGRRRPTATDPHLFLRRVATAWTAHAELANLSSLNDRLPDLYDELRDKRALVDGGARPIPRSATLYSGQEVTFARWPRPERPFLQLERGSDAVNRLIADQCIITTGPWWLFRRQGTGLAIEVKGKTIRPGHHYILVGLSEHAPPEVDWAHDVALQVQGARAAALDVPKRLSDRDEEEILAAGLSLLSGIAIRPVGVVASAWDGEGAAEWLAGETALLGIRSQLAAARCLVTVDGQPYFLDWPSGDTELLMSLDGLAVGTHDVQVSLLGVEDRQLASGTLEVTIRDPHVRPEGATAGEGIRMLATPARPFMTELWDERATIAVEGPEGASAELVVTLLDEDDRPLASLRRTITLPVATEDGWTDIARGIRSDDRFKAHYDGAEACVVAVDRDGIGFASLHCERPFQPLRWRLTGQHDGSTVASLTDGTDGTETRADFFAVEDPMNAVPLTIGERFAAPSRGGLLVATAAEAKSAVILPTQPNRLLGSHLARPSVAVGTPSPRELLRFIRGHHLWTTADLPADAFAVKQQRDAQDAIARGIALGVGGGHWAQLERKLERTREPADHLDYLDEMQQCVGISEPHRALAKEIAFNLYRWLGPETLLPGFAEVIQSTLVASGITGRPTAARFLLTLAGRPGYCLEWEERELNALLERVVSSPVLYRAARFAVLGTRALNDADGLDRSF